MLRVKLFLQADLDTQSCGSESISQLAMVLKPRYHFSGCEGVHYERQPYR